MKRFFQVIKKKKHKRRFAALCLFLIALELFCPVLSDEKISLAAARQADSPITSSVIKFADDESTEKSATASDSQAPENHQKLTANFQADGCRVLLLAEILAH